MKSDKVHSSNGLVVFNNQEEFESYFRLVFSHFPFPGKEEDTIEQGKKSFEVLDLICNMLVPPKDLSIETKRNSVNKFLSTKVNDKISEKNDAIHDWEIGELRDLLSSLDKINKNHNLILRGLSKITEMSTANSLRNELLSKCGTQIKSFETVLINLIDQAVDDQKDVKRIKDSIEDIVKSNTIKNKKVVESLQSICSDLVLNIKSLVRLTSKSEEYKKNIKDFCKLQTEFNELVLSKMS